MNAVGCDLARYEESFDPNKATGPIDFAIQKATQGYQYVDLKYDEIWEGLQFVGIRGAYHYQVAGLSWFAQADHFLETAAKHDYHIYALDVEEYGNAYTDTFFADCKRVVDYWRENSSKKVVLYTNGSTYDQMYLSLSRSYGATYAKTWMGETDLWIASPTTAGFPFMPKYAAGWKFHQHSWVGLPTRWGTGGKGVDENVFNGDVNALYKWAGVEQTNGGELPQEGEPMARYTVKTLTVGSIALRPDHNTNNNAFLYIPANKTMETDVDPFVATQQLSNPSGVYQMVGDKWAQVTYDGQTGWVAVIHKGAPLCTITDNNPPPASEDPAYVVAYWVDGRSQKYVPE